MVEFLSDEWVAELAGAGGDAATDSGAAGDLLVVEPVVRGVPGRGEVRYRITFNAAACAVAALSGDDPPADVCLETDYATAVALARGEVNAQAALGVGRLRVSGDVARLAADAAALARLDDLFSTVRSSTTYPAAAATGAEPTV